VDFLLRMHFSPSSHLLCAASGNLTGDPVAKRVMPEIVNDF
jgi:hypothetical protein